MLWCVYWVLQYAKGIVAFKCLLTSNRDIPASLHHLLLKIMVKSQGKVSAWLPAWQLTYKLVKQNPSLTNGLNFGVTFEQVHYQIRGGQDEIIVNMLIDYILIYINKINLLIKCHLNYEWSWCKSVIRILTSCLIYTTPYPPWLMPLWIFLWYMYLIAHQIHLIIITYLSNSFQSLTF